MSFGNATAATNKTTNNKQISINFKDKALEKAIRQTIKKSKGSIYSTDVNKIKELKLINIGITDITPLKWFSNLTHIELQNIEQPNPNNVNDISSLKNLKKLTYLDLSCNDISNVSVINGLTNLTNLYLGYTDNIKNISFIKYLKKLKHLGLEGMNLGNISTLSTCNNLEELNLWSNDIIDLTPLSRLKKLQKLELSNNKIKDLTPIKDLKSLKFLGLSNNNIENITILANLDKLEHLYLKGNNISNFTSTKLYYKNLKESDFKPYKLLTSLKYSDYQATTGCKFWTWNGLPYADNAIIFHMYDEMDIGESNMQSVEYNIGKKFDVFEGVFRNNTLFYETTHEACIKIFGDNKLLYTSSFINPDSGAVKFKININGVSKLKIKIESPGTAIYDDYEYFIGDPYLY